MSTLKLRKWDSAEHLKSEEDMALYLEACLQEAGDDAAFIAKALGNIARRDLTLDYPTPGPTDPAPPTKKSKSHDVMLVVHLAEAAMRTAGVPVESIYIPAVDHSFIGADLATTQAATIRATNATFDFFHRVLDRPAGQ